MWGLILVGVAVFLSDVGISANVSPTTNITFVSIPLKKFVDASGARILQEGVDKGIINVNVTTNGSMTLAEKFKDDKYVQYYGSISVGTPPQVLTVTFNPVTPLIQLPSLSYKMKCKDSARKTFDTFSSHSLYPMNETISIVEPIDSTVKIYRDTIRVGKTNISDQYFGVVHESSCEKENVYDGVIGLGFTNKYLTLVDNMVQQGLLNQSVIGLYLDKDEKKTFGGEVALGHWNPKYINKPESVEYIPILNSALPEWKIHIKNAFIGKVQISFDTIAVIDTESYFIDIPKYDAELLASHIEAFNFEGNLIVECKEVKKLPQLKITIHNMDFVLNATDYVDTFNSYKGFCTVLIRSREQKVWTLGGAFLGKYYTIFNYKAKRVAFGELKSGSPSISGVWIFGHMLISFILIRIKATGY